MLRSKISLDIIDSVYYDGLVSSSNAAFDYLSPEESEEQLSPAALDLLDHIAEILANEYVHAIKQEKEQGDESSNLR